MEALIAIAAVALAGMGFAGVAVVLALRVGTKTAEIAAVNTARQTAELQLHETATEFAKYKERADAQLAAGRRQVEEMHHDIESFASDPNARGVLRARAQRLLSVFTPRAAGGAEDRAVPAPAAADGPADTDHPPRP